MRFVLIIFSVALTSCVSAEYYQPDVSWLHTQTIGAPCTGPYKQYRNKLQEGVVLEVGGPRVGLSGIQNFTLQMLFRIGEGQSVQLESDLVRVRILDDNTEKVLKITEALSGIPDALYARIHNLPEVHFPALSELQGTGRSSHINMKWGEYSAWYGEGDVFRLTIEPLGSAPRKIEFDLPPFAINGVTTRHPPIRFSKTSGSSLCVQ